jgi:hypothetical protein
LPRVSSDHSHEGVVKSSDGGVGLGFTYNDSAKMQGDIEKTPQNNMSWSENESKKMHTSLSPLMTRHTIPCRISMQNIGHVTRRSKTVTRLTFCRRAQ